MLAEPPLRISATKGGSRNKGCTAFQNSLRTLAILMTGNHERSSTHPLLLLKTLCLLRKRRRKKQSESLTYLSLHHLQCTFTQAIQFEIPRTLWRGRAGSTVPIWQEEKFRVREGNEPPRSPSDLSLKPTALSLHSAAKGWRYICIKLPIQTHCLMLG